MQHSVLQSHPWGSSRCMTWRCPCGSWTQGLAGHTSPGADPLLGSPSPTPGKPNRRAAASPGQGDRERWEETGAQLPEERRDDGVMGEVTLPQAGVNLWWGRRRWQPLAEWSGEVWSRGVVVEETWHTMAAGGLVPRLATWPLCPARQSPSLPGGGTFPMAYGASAQGRGCPSVQPSSTGTVGHPPGGAGTLRDAQEGLAVARRLCKTGVAVQANGAWAKHWAVGVSPPGWTSHPVW